MIVMGMKPNRKGWGNNKGQNLVEFALVVPLLLLLVIGIAEFGRAWMTKNILTGAAREAVRIMAVQTGDVTTATARADNILNSAGITTGYNIIIPPTSVPFDPVSVTVTYQFPVMFAGFIPGLDNATIPLSSTTTMRREY
jgi:Flp pilus assembly protein TadG